MPKFDLSTIELPPVAAKPLYAGVGATDLAVEKVREAVTDVQKRFSGFQDDVKDFEPKDLSSKATDVINTRRARVESRVSELQAEARSLPTKVSTSVRNRVDENVSTVTDAYSDLAKRGEQLVVRIRKQESTQETVSAAKTTTSKAKTTSTQAKKTATTVKGRGKATATTAKRNAESTRATAKKNTEATADVAKKNAEATADVAKKNADSTTAAAKRNAKSATTTAKKSPARSSAKGTVTAAKKTAAAASKATTEAAQKVGD